jgi:ribosomal protein S27AE
VSLIPCDSCHLRVPEKLCQATWAWYRVDGQRVAWRQRICTACFCSSVMPLDVPINYEDGITCPMCGISTNEDMDPCYCTAFLPGSGRLQLEIPTCAPCAAKLRARIQEGSRKLEGSPVEGPSATSPSTPTTRESYWAALGIAPRGK